MTTYVRSMLMVRGLGSRLGICISVGVFSSLSLLGIVVSTLDVVPLFICCCVPPFPFWMDFLL